MPDGLSVYFHDMTARKQAEEALRQSRDAFRLLTEAMPQLVWITDASGCWECANQQWYAYVNSGSLAPLDIEWISCCHPDDQLKMQTLWQTSILTSRPFQIEARLREGKTGLYRWFLIRAVPIHTSTGTIWKWVGTCTDIHEKKCVEEALRESEVRFSRLVQSNLIGITVIDLKGPILEANDAFLSMLGYTRQDLEAGRLNWRALTPPEYQEASTQAVKEVRTGGAAHLYEKAYLAKNSKRVPVLVGSVVFRRIGSKQLAISFVLDLTAQKSAEEERREADQRIKATLESITDAFSHVDAAWRYTYVNCGLEKLMGKKREEIVGRSLWEVVPEVVATPFEDAYRQAMETQQVTYVEGFHPTFQRWLEISIYPTPDGLSFYLHDITDRKEIERQKDLFLGITGHELKTPLAALRGALQLIQRRMKRVITPANALSPELKAFFDSLAKSVSDSVRQVDVQTRLINDLLDISRMTAGTLKLERKCCDLTSIVRQTIEDLRVTAPERTLLLDIPDQVPVHVWANQDRISQVVTNYVTNALRYSHVAQPVQIGLTTEEHTARVWVRDRGPGISEEAQKEIWQRFHQVKGVPILSDSGKGLGLGLYICQMLIAYHQGEVGVESTPGEGSTFWFSLPTLPGTGSA